MRKLITYNDLMTSCHECNKWQVACEIENDLGICQKCDMYIRMNLLSPTPVSFNNGTAIYECPKCKKRFNYYDAVFDSLLKKSRFDAVDDVLFRCECGQVLIL